MPSATAQREGCCECGCGAQVSPSGRFVHGHNRRNLAPVDYLVDENGCWIWQRRRNRHGYGETAPRRAGGSRLAHRVYFEDRYGPVPGGLDLDHRCRVPSCVNPDHLEAVTHAENNRRGKGAKLTVDQVREIKQRLARGESQSALGREYAVSCDAVHSIAVGKSWRDIA